MRHIWSLIIGLVITPLAWFAIAFGQSIVTDAYQFVDFTQSRMLMAGLLLAGAGLFLGLIGSLRTSPLGALFTAAVYLGLSLFALLDPRAASDALHTQWKLGDCVVDMSAPIAGGTLAVIGGMLLMAVFSATRWRSPNAAAGSDWTPPPAVPPWEPPSSEKPSDETPPDEKSAEDKPSDEVPSDDKPSEDKPVTTDPSEKKSSGDN